MKRVLIVLCLSLGVILGGCASKKEDTSLMSPELLYTKGYRRLIKHKYKQAAEYFERIEIEHPYSKWAVKAKLMGAYAHYKKESYDDAVMSLERFIKFHPGNDNIAYAYYLRGICYYDQISTSDKDQSNTQKAQDALGAVTALFPNTEYAEDALKKLNLTYEYQAGQEMEIGRYYLNNGSYLSALNRFQTVVEKYQTTPHIEEALYREVEIYTLLGLTREAKKAAKVLNLNYPDSSWNKKAQKLIK
ncbi:MAG: outer membrane protein assembly factor BamD [Alphaproteobacteria bacterium]|nr:outer membrane protein assembly factor BamD [Alphaproteobacteria bacterium]